jgi:hypothetical protein
LAAFAARALITPGFMPAHDRAFSLEICPEGFPAWLLAHAGHHHHGGPHRGTDHCVFAGACTAGPVSQAPGLAAAASSEPTPTFHVVAPATLVQLVHLPQARAPPAPI